jgi:metal-responsive CopG/Arc/MetJ family transcriptional regulator
MKVSISLPDSIYFEAEETARNMDISRSELYLNAIMDYLKKNNRKNVTRKLNEVYTDEYYKEFITISNAAIKNIREITKNDTR